MQKSKITIGLILYKGEKYLSFSLSSLFAQDYKNVEFLIRDQSPKYEAYNYIKKNLPEVFKKVKIEKGNNLMHSGGHNFLINKMKGDYYFCVSQDMYYPKDFVSKVVVEMEKKKNIHYGSATVKIMNWDFKTTIQSPEFRIQNSSKIDSCGIGRTFYYRFYDIGQGEEDLGQYDTKREVFGASGALAIYRKSALEKVAVLKSGKEKEYFDKRLHYKNDVDISLRLQRGLERCLFISNVKVYHDRKLSSHKSRWKKSSFEKRNSYFGNLVILKKMKTADMSFFSRVSMNIYYTMMHAYVFFFERDLLKEHKKVRKI
ncbi:glycosyltransferase family 2 protein [Candidatus Peregrinibacteria bacterium]|jgi:GT2 family glycosyltransferase|nr:glycosyltransferase family 2 protein [Candidatus Peregrinibacteria bacterium]